MTSAVTSRMGSTCPLPQYWAFRTLAPVASPEGQHGKHEKGLIGQRGRRQLGLPQSPSITVSAI